MQNGAGIRNRDPSLGLRSSVGISNSVNRHTTLTQSMDNLGLSHNLDGPPSPRLWTPQVKFSVSICPYSSSPIGFSKVSHILGVALIQTGAGLNSRSILDVGKGLTSVKGGLELGRCASRKTL